MNKRKQKNELLKKIRAVLVIDIKKQKKKKTTEIQISFPSFILIFLIYLLFLIFFLQHQFTNDNLFSHYFYAMNVFMLHHAAA